MYYYRRMASSHSRRSPGCVLVPLLAVLLFTGCLDATTRVDLEAGGSGELVLTYLIEPAAWRTGVFDESDVARPIPVTRREFERAAARIEGLSLRSYRREEPGEQEADARIRVNARLTFDDTEALRRFLGAQSLEVRTGPDSGSWRMVIAAGAGSAGEGASALAESLAGYSLTFELDPPAPITADTGTTLDDGDRSRQSVSFDRIITATRPIVWEVSW